MNVEDFNIQIPDGDMLETIFSRQRDLIDKYHLIEVANVGQHIPSTSCSNGERSWGHAGALSLNHRASQLRLKDFAWRITEELAEATECFNQKTLNLVHFREELIDALHFSVELCCYSGIALQDFFGGPIQGDALENLFQLFGCARVTEVDFENYYHRETFCGQVWAAVESLGTAMNCLKMKPWKTTPMLTDEKEYRKHTVLFFHQFIGLLSAAGFDAKSCTAMYLNKHAVNKFRQGSNY